MKSSFITAGIVLFIMALIALLLYGYPKYKVWQQGLAGQAELAKAEQNRKIAVQEAEAKKESAKGVAEANRIIGESLRGNESYLRYLWINALNDNQQNVIYVPTEAGFAYS